jgi:hypothetical protein
VKNFLQRKALFFEIGKSKVTREHYIKNNNRIFALQIQYKKEVITKNILK